MATSVKSRSSLSLNDIVVRAVAASLLNLKFTGMTQNLRELQGSYRDFQSNCWVNLRIQGEPCEFYLLGQQARHQRRLLAVSAAAGSSGHRLAL